MRGVWSFLGLPPWKMFGKGCKPLFLPVGHPVLGVPVTYRRDAHFEQSTDSGWTAQSVYSLRYG